MSRRRYDPYHDGNKVAAAHLQMSGFQASTEGWGGGTEGIRVAHPSSPHHDIEIGQSPDTRDGSWQFRLMRKPEDPDYEQDGIRLGRTQMNRVPSPGPEKRQPRDDEYNAMVTAHPRDVAQHLQSFLEHPHVRDAVKLDSERIKTERKMPGPLNGDQFGPRHPMD